MSSSPRSPAVLLAVFLLVTLLAWLPRALPDPGITTVDEAQHWRPRSNVFRKALLSGSPAGTCVAPHPGVTTMWAGALGHAAWRATHDGTVPTHAPGVAGYWWSTRLGVGLVSALAIGLGVVWLLALGEPAVAGLAAVLWIADPFFTGHSRVLHNDALLTSFFLLAVLAGWRASLAERPAPWWAFGAACVALAALSKVTGVLGVVPLVAPSLVTAWRAAPRGRRLRATAGTLLRATAWTALVGTLTALVVWPALWSDPSCVLDKAGAAVRLGGRSHERGNFFAGEAVDDPGWAFYPVALAFRLTPVVLLGLLPAAARAARGHGLARLLWITVGIVGVLLTVQGKKFDRYALPIVPLLDLLAALGWAGVLGWLARAADLRRRVAVGALMVMLGVAAFGPLIRWSPYELLAYDPLLGGTTNARQWVLFGWGEGLERVGTWLRDTTSCRDVVVAKYPRVLGPFTCHVVHMETRVSQASWIVVYGNEAQRGVSDRLAPYVDGVEPVFVAVVRGQEVAWVYPGPVPPRTVRGTR